MKTKLLSPLRWFASLNIAALLLALGLGGASTARAASDSWITDGLGAVDGLDWANSANWLGAQVPGDLAADNTDVATFTNTLTLPARIAPGVGRHIGGINFGNTSTNAFDIWLDGTLLLNNGSVIQSLPDNGSAAAVGFLHRDRVLAPITINGSAATFYAGATNPLSTLEVRPVTGSAAGATTLNLDGANTGNNQVNGIIADGAGGPLSVVKSGTGLWELSGNKNTYTGPTTVNAGILSIVGAGGLNTPGNLGETAYAGNITNNSIFEYKGGRRQTLSGNISGSGLLSMAGSGPRLTLAGTNTYTGGTSNSSSGILVFQTTDAKPATGPVIATATGGVGLGLATSGNYFTSANMDSLWTNGLPGVDIATNSGVGIDTTAGNFTYTLDPAFPARALKKLGANTLNLVASGNTNIKDLFVEGGILNIVGSVSNSPSRTAALDMSDDKGIIRNMIFVPTGSQLTTETLLTGHSETAGNDTAASLVINGGDVVTTVPASGNNGLRFGWGNYGGFFMSGGSAKTRWFDAGVVSGVPNPTSVTVAQITGGNLTNDNFIILRAAYSEFTMIDGNVNRNLTENAISLGERGVATVFTMAGGSWDNTGTPTWWKTDGTIKFGRIGATTTARGIANLNGGTLLIRPIIASLFNTAGSYVNFNGGILKSSRGSDNFLPLNVTAYVNGAFGTYAGGAVVDVNGSTGFDNGTTNNIGFAVPLLAPTGNGVSGLTLDNAGSGYIGAPYVDIVGDGIGATAYVQVDLNPASGTFGRITNAVVTNPGVDYTTIPTVILRGGGGTGGAVSVSGITPNTSGGLTKLGAGVLTLKTANTYTGATVVSNGTLLVNSPGSLDAGSAVTVKSGGTLGGSGTIGGPVTFNAGSHAVLTDAAQLTMSSSLNIAASADVHLNLPVDLGVGNYTLATYNTAGSSGAFNSTPVIDSGSIAAGLTGTIVTGGGIVELQVVAAPPVAPDFAAGGGITVSGGTVSLTGTGAIGTPYSLWTSTNVALPMANWTLVSSGTVTVSPFTINLPVPASAQQFYRFSNP